MIAPWQYRVLFYLLTTLVILANGFFLYHKRVTGAYKAYNNTREESVARASFIYGLVLLAGWKAWSKTQQEQRQKAVEASERQKLQRLSLNDLAKRADAVAAASARDIIANVFKLKHQTALNAASDRTVMRIYQTEVNRYLALISMLSPKTGSINSSVWVGRRIIKSLMNSKIGTQPAAGWKFNPLHRLNGPGSLARIRAQLLKYTKMEQEVLRKVAALFDHQTDRYQYAVGKYKKYKKMAGQQQKNLREKEAVIKNLEDVRKALIYGIEQLRAERTQLEAQMANTDKVLSNQLAKEHAKKQSLHAKLFATETELDRRMKEIAMLRDELERFNTVHSSTVPMKPKMN